MKVAIRRNSALRKSNNGTLNIFVFVAHFCMLLSKYFVIKQYTLIKKFSVYAYILILYNKINCMFLKLIKYFI